MISSLVWVDVVLLERRQQFESVAAKRRFAAIAALEAQRSGNGVAAKIGGAVLRVSDLLRSPAGTLPSASGSGQ